MDLIIKWPGLLVQDPTPLQRSRLCTQIGLFLYFPQSLPVRLKTKYNYISLFPQLCLAFSCAPSGNFLHPIRGKHGWAAITKVWAWKPNHEHILKLNSSLFQTIIKYILSIETSSEQPMRCRVRACTCLQVVTLGRDSIPTAKLCLQFTPPGIEMFRGKFYPTGQRSATPKSNGFRYFAVFILFSKGLCPSRDSISEN